MGFKPPCHFVIVHMKLTLCRCHLRRILYGVAFTFCWKFGPWFHGIGGAQGHGFCVLIVGVCAQHHSGVNYLLVTCVCKLCLDKMAMWLENSRFLNSENFTKSGMLETFSSPVDEDVLVILLRTGLSSVLVFWTWYVCAASCQFSSHLESSSLCFDCCQKASEQKQKLRCRNFH